jgi:hypothetical protein
LARGFSGVSHGRWLPCFWAGLMQSIMAGGHGGAEEAKREWSGEESRDGQDIHSKACPRDPLPLTRSLLLFSHHPKMPSNKL